MAKTYLDDEKKKSDDTGRGKGRVNEQPNGALSDLFTAMQRTFGNRAVGKMVDAGGPATGGQGRGLLASLSSMLRLGGAKKAPPKSGAAKSAPKYWAPSDADMARDTKERGAAAPQQSEDAKNDYRFQDQVLAEKAEVPTAKNDYRFQDQVLADQSEDAKGDYRFQDQVLAERSEVPTPKSDYLHQDTALAQHSEDAKGDYRFQDQVLAEQAEVPAPKSGYLHQDQVVAQQSEDAKNDYRFNDQVLAEQSEDAKSDYRFNDQVLAEQSETSSASGTVGQAVADAVGQPSRSATTDEAKSSAPGSGQRPLLQMGSQYKGENLTRAEVSKRGMQQPRRHAADLANQYAVDIDKAASKVELLFSELQALQKRGEDKGGGTADYGAKLKAIYRSRETEYRNRKMLTALGLDHPEEELKDYKVQYLASQSERDPYRLQMGPAGLMRGDTAPKPFDTTGMTSYGAGTGFAMFVMAPDGAIYTGEHRVQRFHHSSFLAGGDAAAAGELRIENGELKAITHKTGHYQAGHDEMEDVLEKLESWNVGLSGVRIQTGEADYETGVRKMVWTWLDIDAKQWLEQRRAKRQSS